MTVEDFFNFDETEYAQRISTYDLTRLRKQEIVKTRQQVSASFTIGTGIGGAWWTLGSTLLLSGYGSRAMYVARKKLALIEAELRRRGVPEREPQKRDFWIPFSIGTAGSVVGLGVAVAGADSVAAAATSSVTAAGAPAPGPPTDAMPGFKGWDQFPKDFLGQLGPNVAVQALTQGVEAAAGPRKVPDLDPKSK
jgi:hypothetical protein